VSDVRCPNCGAKRADGAEFQVITPYRAEGCFDLVGVDPDGVLLAGVGDSGSNPDFGRPLLDCVSCGHQWVTSRDWRSA
jgi:hypothetical protein